MDEILKRLLDERLPKLEFGPPFLKALNILMLKVIENSDRNDCYW